MPHVSYFWDEIEDNVTEEYNEDGSTLASYTTEPTRYGSVLSQDRSGERRYFQFDGQGNTTELTNDTGNVTDSRRYDSCGRITESTGTSICPFQFQASRGLYQPSSLGRVSFRLREYYPLLGRYLDHQQQFGWQAVASGYSATFYTSVIIPAVFEFMTIKPLKQHLGTHKCGTTFYQQWEFSIDLGDNGEEGAPCAGWIVQEVRVACDIGTCITERLIETKKGKPPKRVPCCDCNRESHTFTYYEAWYVKMGQNTSEDRQNNDEDYTDKASYAAQDRRCGRITQRGEVRFYCENAPGVGIVSGWQKQQWYPNAGHVCRTTPWNLRSSQEAPFWRRTPRVGPRTRVFQLDFFCCNCKGDFRKNHANATAAPTADSKNEFEEEEEAS